MKKVYIGELDKFGYTLTVVGKTEAEVREALAAEYVRAYTEINGEDPREEENKRWGGTYYDNMLEDMVIYDMTLGKVEWL